MQSHITPQEKTPDPEIAALSDRISRLEQQLAAEKNLTTPRFRRSNHGSVDCLNLRGAGVGDI